MSLNGEIADLIKGNENIAQERDQLQGEVDKQPAPMPAITKEAIEAFKRQRAIECGEKLQALLDEYDCSLVAMPQFTADGRIVAQVQLVAK